MACRVPAGPQVQERNQTPRAGDATAVCYLDRGGHGASSMNIIGCHLGATKMIPQVPATQAKLNSHNKILSSTVATYFQSSET